MENPDYFHLHIKFFMRNYFITAFLIFGISFSAFSQVPKGEDGKINFEPNPRPGGIDLKGLVENYPIVYRYQNKILDLKSLKFIDSTSVFIGEIKRENYYAPMFRSDETERKVNYKNFIFELKENRDVTISDLKGKLIKTISDPDKKILADNISGNSVIFSISTGVVCAIRLSGENGYHIRKLDENGNVLNTWKVVHTLFKKTKEYTESIPYIYYFAHTNTEMIFSSMHYGKPQKTVILNLVDGTEKKMNYSVGGIIVDPKTNSLAGTVNIKEDRKTIEIEMKDNKFEIKDGNYGDAAKTILTDSILVIAHYHNIATGCDVNAYSAKTGNLLWKGDVKQLMVGHSKYYNIVHLTFYKDKIILEGNEAYGSYLQVLDLKTGKRLFELMPDSK